MPVGESQSRRVVVIDPVLRSREHLRRAIRSLGHAPLVFNDIEELLPLREGLLRCAAVCLGLPHYPADLQAWVRAARNVVTTGVPMLFLTRENPMKAPGSLRCAEGDLVLAAPTCFADVHNGLQAFFTQHGIASGTTGLTWGGYRFVPSREAVVFDEIEIHLRPLDFELALEFFHNTNRVLSRDWLRSMAAGLVPEAGGRWLDASVARLRTQLGLASFEGCEWQLSSIRYGGLKLSRTHGRKTAQPVAMPESVLRREPSSVLSG